MAEQYAGITLGVDVSQVNNASKSLKDFKRANEEAAKGMQDFTNQEYVARQRAKELAESLAGQRKELDNVRQAIDPTAAKMRRLSQAAASLDKLWSAGALPDESFFQLSEILETQTNKLHQTRNALTEEGRAAAEEAKQKQLAQRAGERFLADLEAQANALGKSATELQQMKAAQLGVSSAAAPLISQIEQQNAAMKEAAIAARAAAQAQKEEAAAAQRAEKAKKGFIEQLESEVNALGKTRTELLEMKAAQLGVSDKAAPLISQLRKQGNEMNAAGISAGQYSQAMRMLPAQITDVATSLASGMPVWMVAIQQGGQITDSFGGISGAMASAKDAVIDYVNSLGELKSAFADVRTMTDTMIVRFGRATTMIGGGLVAAIAGIGYAAYSAYSEVRELDQAILLSGGYAIQTKAQFDAMTGAIADATGVVSSSVEDVVRSLAASGKYTSKQIEQITKTTVLWGRATGEQADKVIDYFDKISNDPVKGLAELNKSFNFLSEGQLTYINNLEKTAGKTAAVSAATEIFAKTMDERLGQIYDSASPLEKMWDDIKKWASDSWSNVSQRTLAALNLITDVVQGTINQIRFFLAQGDIVIGEFIVRSARSLSKLPGANQLFSGIIKQQQDVVDRAKKNSKEYYKAWEEADKRVRGGEQGYIDRAGQKTRGSGYSEKTKDAVDKETEALKEKNKQQKVSVDQGDRILDQYNGEIVALQAQLRVLQDHKGLNDQISQQRKTLWNEQAKIQVLEEASARRKLTADEQSVLAHKETILSLAEQKAELGDAIQKQERLNKLQDDATKFVNKTNEAIKALNDNRALGDRAQQRANEKAQIIANWKNQGGGETDPQLQNMLKAQDELYAAEESKRADWLAGAKNAFENYGDSAMNMYANVGEIATSALDGLTNQMTEFLTTGKASFKDFASSIISMIIKMITQMVIFNAISGLMGGSTFSFSGMSSGKGFAGGGFTGSGGKYDPAGVVHKGEFVFTKEATRRLGVDNLYKLMRGYANGGAVGGASIGSTGSAQGSQFSFGDINVDINNGNDPKGLERGVRAIFAEMIQASCSQGGAVYNYVNGRA